MTSHQIESLPATIQNPEMRFMSYREGGAHETNFHPLTALEFVESIEEESVDWILEGYFAKGVVGSMGSETKDREDHNPLPGCPSCGRRKHLPR